MRETDVTVIDTEKIAQLERRLTMVEHGLWPHIDDIRRWVQEADGDLGQMGHRIEVLEERSGAPEFDETPDVRLGEALEALARSRLTLRLVADSMIASVRSATDVHLAVMSASTAAAVLAEAAEARDDDDAQ